MAKLGFHIVRLWVAFLSIHPYWLLYLKSDVYYFLVYHLLRYRRKVVRQNLVRSFPDKDEKEIKRIERRFYQNLCDMFVETPKMLRMKSNGYQSRITYTNPEVAQRLYEQGKNVFYAIPHSGNWEWFGKMIPQLTPQKALAVYKRVKSPVFEQLMLYIRTCDSTLEMVESNMVLRRLAQLRDSQNAVLMMADQSSPGLASDYWTEFLHQDTCWFTGIERIAKKLDYAIVFVDMRRKGRGRYEVSFELVTDNPKETKDGEIMERYVRCVEHFIEANPDNWLWSHRRWKHTRNQQA
ncbi:MAG: lysophospholipid acyltransferase family protein [Bacteroidales bacterium]|nr:lysophospholipid acyltransferase family protein [Bacteroidales bacterium]